jgi:hypothetical protein
VKSSAVKLKVPSTFLPDAEVIFIVPSVTAYIASTPFVVLVYEVSAEPTLKFVSAKSMVVPVFALALSNVSNIDEVFLPEPFVPVIDIELKMLSPVASEAFQELPFMLQLMLPPPRLSGLNRPPKQLEQIKAITKREIKFDFFMVFLLIFKIIIVRM